MPTYEYICRACGHEFEEFHSILAAPILACPSCRKKKVERKISGGGAVIFKGGGFYETDYRSESYRSGADAERKGAETNGAEATATGKAEGSSEGKSEGAAGAAQGGDGSSSRKGTPSSESAKGSSTGTTAADEPKGAASRGAKAPSKPDGASPAAAAENRRIESRATHASRIGRGVGNIVSGKPAPKKKR
jgi:putative FmdB family regulatory protein